MFWTQANSYYLHPHYDSEYCVIDCGSEIKGCDVI